jgi:septal ring factor EnvC (AmiA/AmiB activator)
MLKLLNDLIIEHGSAQVSKERIELLKEQYANLERDKAELAEQLRQTQQEIERLNQIIADTPTPTSKPHDVEEAERKILDLLFETNEEFSASHLGSVNPTV